MAASIFEPHVTSQLDIESLAIFHGLQHCLNQRLANIIIKSDCQLEVDELLHFNNPSSVVGNLLIDIKDLLAKFINCNIIFGSWLGNEYNPTRGVGKTITSPILSTFFLKKKSETDIYT